VRETRLRESGVLVIVEREAHLYFFSLFEQQQQRICLLLVQAMQPVRL
jgi:hypothetical protein